MLPFVPRGWEARTARSQPRRPGGVTTRGVTWTTCVSSLNSSGKWASSPFSGILDDRPLLARPRLSWLRPLRSHCPVDCLPVTTRIVCSLFCLFGQEQVAWNSPGKCPASPWGPAGRVLWAAPGDLMQRPPGLGLPEQVRSTTAPGAGREVGAWALGPGCRGRHPSITRGLRDLHQVSPAPRAPVCSWGPQG